MALPRDRLADLQRRCPIRMLADDASENAHAGT